MLKLNLANIFTYHAPTADQRGRYENIRAHARALGEVIQATTPESREQSVALTNLQQTVMWANAAIAINEPGADHEEPKA